MAKNNNVTVTNYINCIVAKFNNRKIIIYPTLSGIQIYFRRLLDSEEKQKIQNNVEYEITTASTDIINNKIVQTSINMIPEAAYILAQVLIDYGPVIQKRMILNSLGSDRVTRQKQLELMDLATEDEMLDILTAIQTNTPDVFYQILSEIETRTNQPI